MKALASSDTPLVAVSGGLMLGGSTTFLVNLARAFQERGLRLPVICLSDENEHARDFAVSGTPVKLISRRRHIYEDRLQLAYEELQALRPRAVLACLSSESFEVLRLVPAGVARLGIIQSHDPGPHRTVQFYTEWLDGIVGVSRTICEHVSTFPEVARRRIECIPYGISFGAAPVRASRALGTPLRLIYLGRLIEEQKRVSRLIALVRALHERGVKFQFTFVGSGPQAEEMRAAIGHVSGVEFRGEVPNHEVPALLAAQDVFVLLSDYEGLPLSLLEAMGAGAVPVVSDLPSGIRDVVTNDSGVRVPVGDIEAAAQAIIALDSDPARLAALSLAATQTARNQYSATRMAERYVGLVAELARPVANWPPTVAGPVPLGVKFPWMYSGLPRQARRWAKRLIAARQGSSSPS